MCGEVFNSKIDVGIHVTRVHVGRTNVLDPRGRISCEYCLEVFQLMRIRSQHIRN